MATPLLPHTTQVQCLLPCIWAGDIHHHLPPHSLKDTLKVSHLSVTIRDILTNDLTQGLNLVTLRPDSPSNMLSIIKSKYQNK